MSKYNEDPNDLQCQQDCQCNNQKFEGYCSSGVCFAIPRKPCDRKGLKQPCALLVQRGTCEWGVQVCHPDYLKERLWGDCDPYKVTETEDTLELCRDFTDNNCNGQHDQYDPGCKKFCLKGEWRPCDTKPLGDKLNEGPCRAGVQDCKADGTWGECKYDQKTLPRKEECNGKDDDCDGNIDNGLPDCKFEPCRDGTRRPCYTELSQCRDGKCVGCNKQEDGSYKCLGACRAGFRICVKGQWGGCQEQNSPRQDTCDGFDNDCDGVVDEGCLCKEGSMRLCYTGPKDAASRGICLSGKQKCVNGQWGACEGSITPKLELCNGTDDDCDGQIDNNILGAKPCEKQKGVCAGAVRECVQGIWTCQYKQWNSAYTPDEKDSECDGLDNDCDGEIDEDCKGCRPETDKERSCYTGTPANTKGKGVCQNGKQFCINFKWTSCVGDITPGKEECGDGKDNNCDGQTDENCPCVQGTVRSCYTGDANTRNQGLCRAGVQTCEKDPNTQTLKWGACINQILPTKELCNGKDDDCDGKDDNGCTQTCFLGQSRPCYTGDSKTRNIGSCREGTQLCIRDAKGVEQATWSVCLSEQLPGKELCDGKDNDCDGTIDNGCTQTCAIGQLQPCYTGDSKTRNIGSCREGTQLCISNGRGQSQWSACLSEQLPGKELCDGKDNDCNGAIDDSVTCPTNQICRAGRCINPEPSGKENTSTPEPSGKENTSEPVADGGFSQEPASQEPQPEGSTPEIPEAIADAGSSPETRPEPVCVNGTQISCYSGPIHTLGKGDCQAGTLTCVNGQWGPCVGEVTPKPETCSLTDDDCDGQQNEKSDIKPPSLCANQKGVCKGAAPSCFDGSWSLPCTDLNYQLHSTDFQLVETRCDKKDNDCDGTVDEGCPP